MAIFFHAEGTSFKFSRKNAVKDWICRVLKNESREPGNINIIFTSDTYLLNINKQYLERNYLTDIITFDYSEGELISGDLFISIDRIKDNSNSMQIPEEKELLRVIIHGILHLIGYDDDLKDEKTIMSRKEDQYIEIYFNKH